jgi:hypothetical protein
MRVSCPAVLALAVLLLVSVPAVAHAAGRHRNFAVAVYVRAQEVRQMGDPAWLSPRWDALSRQLDVDKVYLETHRDTIVVDDATLEKAKSFFESRGVRTAGGITFTIDERNRYETFCYSNPEHRRKAKEIVEHTARHFDELILDDFFFTSCKCDLCIEAKGERSWTDYRLELMRTAARELVVGPAKAVNPKVKVVIKYPNWYDHFQFLGFDLDEEPRIFDGIYTGTETRDPVFNHQHLQPYHGYSIFRYFENVKPGGNGGGWVDPFGRRTLDRYAEQLRLTLLAKAPEITLFSFGHLLESRPVGDGTTVPDTLVARVAAYTFDETDGFLGRLGRPVGVKSYKPFPSSGEDFLQSYLGMIGIPMDVTPEFPTDTKTVLLTEQAKADPGIVEKIEGRLAAGKEVVITSGLLRALQGHGIEQIAEIGVGEGRALVQDFWRFSDVYHAEVPILVPQVRYATNDAWDLLTGLHEGVGYPMMLQAGYSRGQLTVLTIPDGVGDLYRLPDEVLAAIRRQLSKDLYVSIEGPSQISLFAYDNDTFVVQSFLPHAAMVRIVTESRLTRLRDLVSGREVTGEKRGDRTVFETPVFANAYRAFAAE